MKSRSYIKETSDTSYIITTYNAQTNNLKYIKEQTLNRNYRDIASKFSSYIFEDGINKLQNTTAYKNTINSNGRLIKSTETDYSNLAITETVFKYLAFDENGNPTKIVLQKFDKPVMLTTRIYSYYK